MADAVTGFEFVTMDRLREGDRSLPYDPKILLELKNKGLVRRRAGAWSLTDRGRLTVDEIFDEAVRPQDPPSAALH